HRFASLLVRRAMLSGAWSDYAHEEQAYEQERTLREQAIALYQQSISLWKLVEAANPPGRQSSYRYNQAMYLNNLAYYQRRQGQLEEALASIEQCIALEEAGYAKPGLLAAAYGEKAQILTALGRFREALRFDDKAVQEIEQAAEQTGNSKLQKEVW